jgi:hypothetical protein
MQSNVTGRHPLLHNLGADILIFGDLANLDIDLSFLLPDLPLRNVAVHIIPKDRASVAPRQSLIE